MTTTSYMPVNDSGKADLLEHLSKALLPYSTLLNIAAEDMTSLTADAVCFRYALHSAGDMQAYSQNWTAFKNQLREGSGNSASWPVPPVLVTPIPPAVKPGVITRLSSLAAQIKTHKNYTIAIGKDLGLIGAEVIIDPVTWKPIISVQFQAGHPIVQWTKGQASAIEIWVDRNDTKGFGLMTINTEPNTQDMFVLPETGTSEMWRYKAIYLLHDVQVGQWSDVISVSVGG